MAKFKPAGARRPEAKKPNAIGCIVLLVLLFLLIYAVMFYAVKG